MGTAGIAICMFGLLPYQKVITLEELDYVVEEMHSEVQQGMRSGELSPYDKLEDGSTLLHVSTASSHSSVCTKMVFSFSSAVTKDCTVISWESRST